MYCGGCVSLFGIHCSKTARFLPFQFSLCVCLSFFFSMFLLLFKQTKHPFHYNIKYYVAKGRKQPEIHRQRNTKYRNNQFVVAGSSSSSNNTVVVIIVSLYRSKVVHVATDRLKRNKHLYMALMHSTKILNQKKKKKINTTRKAVATLNVNDNCNKRISKISTVDVPSSYTYSKTYIAASAIDAFSYISF